MALKVMGKIAAPRAVREWQEMRRTGQEPASDTIAQGYGQLGLRPRFLKNISTGGNEAAVDLRMGQVPGSAENQSGYLATKLYKPDSPITTGDHTTELLQQKQDYTNTARSLSPEAKSMVPAMYGHETLRGPDGQGPLRHLSHHEYVPDAAVRPGVSDVRQLERHVFEPMQAQGKHMADVPRLERRSGGTFGIGGNRGNASAGIDGPPKVTDFLPAGNDSVLYKLPVKDHIDTAYTKPEHMTPLRKDVYRPQPGPLSVQHPAPTPQVATVRPGTPAPAVSGSVRAPATMANAAPRAAPALQAAGTVASPRALLENARTEIGGTMRAIAPAAATVRPGLRSAATAVGNFARRLPKIAAISDDEAIASLDRLQAIEQAKPTAGQLGRYAGIGAVSGPLIGAAGDAIGGRPILGGGSVRARLRGGLAGAATGALASGAIPLVRTHLDQEAEKKLLRGYVDQHAAGPKLARALKPRKVGPGIRKQYQRSDFATPAKARIAGSVDGRVTQQGGSAAVQAALGKLFGGKAKEKDSAMWGGSPSRTMNEDYPAEFAKAGFQTSAYDGRIGYPSAPQASQVPALKARSLRAVVEKKAAGAPTRGGFLLASSIPPLKQLPLEGVVEKKAGIPTTPAGLLAHSQAVGQPRVSAPAGPSIAQIAKPKGFGRPLPGATKTL